MTIKKYKEIKNTVNLSIRCFEKEDLKILISLDNNKWHMSISHASRNPTWEEIKDAWYTLVPQVDKITGAMYFPPQSELVNLHNFCFHIFET